MAASVSVGQAVAHPSAVAAVVATGAAASTASKTGTVLATGLTIAQVNATSHGGVTYGTTNTGVAVQWTRQPLPTLHPVADLT